MKKHFWAIFYSLALTAFSVYAILDTFVISDVYQNDTTQINMSVFDNINSTEKENYNETEINSPETSSEKTAEIFMKHQTNQHITKTIKHIRTVI